MADAGACPPPPRYNGWTHRGHQQRQDGTMGVRSRKPDRVRRQAMPVTSSIAWKPVRDSHYIVASLQPAGGGLRQLFVRQSVLRDIQALARWDHPVAGLLLGQRLDCALTLTPYMLIESHVELAVSSLDERDMTDAILSLQAHYGRDRSVELLGWYSGRHSADAVVSRTHAAVHRSC